jgi:GxxExxY protein
MNLEPLSKKEENTAKKIVDAAYCIHKELGPGLLERVYEVCLCYELPKVAFFVEDRWRFLLFMMV